MLAEIKRLLNRAVPKDSEDCYHPDDAYIRVRIDEYLLAVDKALKKARVVKKRTDKKGNVIAFTDFSRVRQVLAAQNMSDRLLKRMTKIHTNMQQVQMLISLYQANAQTMHFRVNIQDRLEKWSIDIKKFWVKLLKGLRGDPDLLKPPLGEGISPSPENTLPLFEDTPALFEDTPALYYQLQGSQILVETPGLPNDFFIKWPKDFCEIFASFSGKRKEVVVEDVYIDDCKAGGGDDCEAGGGKAARHG